jgi:hypothetical protein
MSSFAGSEEPQQHTYTQGGSNQEIDGDLYWQAKNFRIGHLLKSKELTHQVILQRSFL